MSEPDVKQQAVEIIERMEVIIRNEMLFKGEYLSANIERQDLKDQGSVCGGHRVCAIGSLWMAAGIRPKPRHNSSGAEVWELRSAYEEFRYSEFCVRPVLEVVYDALNEVAQERLDFGTDEYEIADGGDPFSAALEELFEHTDIDPIDLLEVTSAAIARLKAT